MCTKMCIYVKGIDVLYTNIYGIQMHAVYIGMVVHSRYWFTQMSPDIYCTIYGQYTSSIIHTYTGDTITMQHSMYYKERNLNQMRYNYKARADTSYTRLTLYNTLFFPYIFNK